MNRIRKSGVLLLALVVLFGLAGADSVQAADSTSTIARGQVLSQGMSPFDTWTIYYNPDGTFPTLTAVEPAGWWAVLLASKQPTPVTVMSVYIWGPRLGWQFVNSYQVTPWATTLPLFGAKGTQYKFVIKNYQMDTPVYVQVK